MRLFTLSLTFWILLSGNVDGQALIPAKVNSLALGSASDDIRREFPESKNMAESGDKRRRLVLVELPPLELWDSAMFELRDGKIVSTSLLLGVVENSDVASKRERILDEALKVYGTIFKGRIALSADNNLEPILMWTQGKTTIYLSVAIASASSGAEKRQSRLVIAAADRPISEFFQMPSSAEIETSAFNLLIGDALRRRGIK